MLPSSFQPVLTEPRHCCYCVRYLVGLVLHLGTEREPWSRYRQTRTATLRWWLLIGYAFRFRFRDRLKAVNSPFSRIVLTAMPRDVISKYFFA